MSQEIKKKGLLKRKIISLSLLLVFVFSQVVIPVKQANAMVDINQAIANIVSVTSKISQAIEKIGGGVLKAGIATTLNTFAQTLAQNTVTGMATGNWGQAPLFFQFPLEDLLAQTADQIAGDFIDKLSEELKYDLCKPLTADLSFKFKLVLDILPSARSGETDTNPAKCTLSNFINTVEKSFENITGEVRRVLAADCFNEFVPSSSIATSTPTSADSYSAPVYDLGSKVTKGVSDTVDSLATSVYDTAISFTGFSYDALKKAYLYDVSSLNESEASRSYFTKKTTFYTQKAIRSTCTTYSATTNYCEKIETNTVTDSEGNTSTETSCGTGVEERQGSYYCKLKEYTSSDGKTAADKSNCLTDALVNYVGFGFGVGGTSGATNKVCTNDTTKVCLSDADCGGGTCTDVSNTGNCITYELPDKDANGKYIADTAKQKKFLTQYKTCFLPKMQEAFKSLLSVGTGVSQVKLRQQKIKDGCTAIIDSLITTSDSQKNAPVFYKAYDLYLQNKPGNVLYTSNDDAKTYKSIMRAGLLAKRDDSVGCNGYGDLFAGYIKSNISFFDGFEQALVNCSKVGSDGKISVSDCQNESGEDGIVSSNDEFLGVNTATNKIYGSDFKKLMMSGNTGSGGNPLVVGTMLLDYYDDKPAVLTFSTDLLHTYKLCLIDPSTMKPISDDAKISAKRDDLINICVANANNQIQSLGYSQQQQNKQYIEQQKREKALEIQERQDIVKNEVAKSDTKPVSEEISHEIKTPATMVTFNLTQALGASSTMLQPTGDLFIDPIKIFLTVLLQQGSQKLMEGLFSRAFPTLDVDEDLSSLDSINTNLDSEGDAEGASDVCSVAGPVAIGGGCVFNGVFNDGICSTCYCEKTVNNISSGGANTFGTCQPKP